MKRRTFLMSALLLAASLSATAADKELAAVNDARVVNVVKVLNFSCPICRAAENQDAQIAAAAERTGGRLVFAPLPSEEGEYAREKVYYASRKQGPEIESQIRASLYKGSQDMGQPFLDVIQVIEWLKDDIPNANINFSQLSQDAQSPDASQALGRAASIASRAGSQALPSYVLVQGNAPVGTVDPATSGRGVSLLNMREELVKRVEKLSAPK